MVWQNLFLILKKKKLKKNKIKKYYRTKRLLTQLSALDESGEHCEGQRVDVLSVAAKSHPALAQTNRVLALRRKVLKKSFTFKKYFKSKSS